MQFELRVDIHSNEFVLVIVNLLVFVIVIVFVLMFVFASTFVSVHGVQANAI